MSKHWNRTFMFLIVLAVACGRREEAEKEGLSGAISVDGSSTVYPITEAVAEEFQREHPDVRVTVGISGTGGGFKKFGRGEIDISDASRPIKTSEVKVAKENKIEFIELPVAYDGLAVVVNPKNSWCSFMTVAELMRLWEPEAQGKITRWSQIRAGWPNKEIHLFGPGVDSGTYDYFTDAIVGKEGATQWTPLFAEKHFGILPLLSGTVLVTVIAILVALPTGLLSALYLSEYAPERMRKVVKPILETLAGIPTVVYGYFALLFVTPLLQNFVPGLAGFNALSPGIVMGIMILPLVASLSEDAMRAVPLSLREGAYALGSTKLQVSFRIVIPSAFSGITAAFMLAVSRAIGETMIVAIAAGQQPRLTFDPTVPVETMTAYIVQVSLGDTPAGTLEYKTIFVVGMMLFVSTLLLNLLSYRLRARFREVYR